MAHRRTSSRFSSSLPITNSRMSSATKPQIFSPPASAMSLAFTLPILPASLSPSLHPRKPRRRTTFIALIALICLSAYICFFARPQLVLASSTLRDGAAKLISTPPTPAQENNNDDLPRSRLFRFPPSQHKPKPSLSSLPQITLTESQELAAITFFLASLPENQIPASVDPTRAIDPEVILDFDTRSGARAEEGVREIVEDVWRSNPVVVFSKVCLSFPWWHWQRQVSYHMSNIATFSNRERP